MRTGLFLLVFVLLSTLSTAMFAQSVTMAITLRDALTFTINEPEFLPQEDNAKSKTTNQIQAVAKDQISVVSSRGYIVKAIFGQTGGPGIDGLVKLSSLIGSSNKGNTTGLVLESDVVLPPANGSPVTVITSPNCSWNGIFSTNTFNIAYKIGNEFAYIDKNGAPSIIPVIFTVLQP